MIECLTCSGEAATEALQAREWEDVEECRDEPVAGWGEEISEGAALSAPQAEVEEDLAGHRDCYVLAQARGESVEHHGTVEHRDVVGDDEQRTVRDWLVGRNDSRAEQHAYQRADDGFQRGCSQNLDRPE